MKVKKINQKWVKEASNKKKEIKVLMGIDENLSSTLETRDILLEIW